MESKKLFKDYKEHVRDNKESYIQEYRRVFKAVEESPAKYKGKPVEFLYQPLFLTEEDYNRFKTLTDQLMTILNKVIDKYLKDESFRRHFGFSPLLEKLILKDPGYDKNVPMGRFDIFYNYDDGGFQFCELNTDGSSGMIEQMELQRICQDSLAVKNLEKKYNVRGFELFQSWVNAFLENYRQYSKGAEKPQIAIMDWLSGDPPSEFIAFKEVFEANGCPTVIVDPSWLEYKNNCLYYKDFKIDCIYRRAVTWEIIEGAHKAMDFIEAYLAGDVCVIGPIRSQIIHNKNIFAILHDEEKTPFLSNEDRNFVKKHIPFTRIFEAANEELVNYTINHKDAFVLKPMDKYASKGVRIGRDYSKDEWIKIIQEEAKEEYLLQEFCRLPRIPMAKFNHEDVEFLDFNYIIGLFMYNERLQGVYTRTGTKNLIGSIVECYTAPNFVLSVK
ncbi:glutathionylspermidine synthase family protein [Alkaliphilus serpentinus]|uniref:Glutathionylspermidine synthase preATP-grasp n=1 Tax=Alkaliphilus serpentinus TaxID=1482731 RepID=A0A833HQY8_9FIRM|nr:glutathionylspermidine synthase family protein [Alkaliphilus serpentinus]KAB3532507.1 hypothetical protein F8153_02400 [Alkaliphilus serpentinus]